MAALLTSVSGSTDDVVKYINECREMGIAVEPPDINVSDAYFTPHGEAIRFGLAAVKNVGHNAIESIVAARKETGEFKSIFQFCEKVDLHLLNKRVMESLIKSGAMDPAGASRAVDGGGRQRDGPRPEERRRTRRWASTACSASSSRTKNHRRRSRCPTFPTGMSTSGWATKRKFSASSSPAIRWRNIARSCSTSTPCPPPKLRS